jgi:catechol 2,3-dioxygenase-like lactoylglutathione lyase family enzyme
LKISNVIPQLRTTDLESSIRFYTALPGFSLEFCYDDFYAGIRMGNEIFHLKRVDAKDPSIDDVQDHGHFHLYFGVPDTTAAAKEVREAGIQFIKDVYHTEWNTREFIIEDDQGHILYFGQAD